MKKVEISQLYTEMDGSICTRPKTSKRFRKYLQTMVTTEIIDRFDLFYGLSVTFSTSITYTPKEKWWKSTDYSVTPSLALVYGPEIKKRYGEILITVLIPAFNFDFNRNHNVVYVEFMVEVVEYYFKNYAKHRRRISESFWEDFAKKIDYDYIASLPFPAPFEEQGYSFDDCTPDYKEAYKKCLENSIS